MSTIDIVCVHMIEFQIRHKLMKFQKNLTVAFWEIAIWMLKVWLWSPADSNPRRRSFEWKKHEIELDSNPCLDRPQTSIFKPTILKIPSLNKYYKNIAHTILFAAGANSCTCFVARSDRTFLTWHSLERFYCIDMAVC